MNRDNIVVLIYSYNSVLMVEFPSMLRVILGSLIKDIPLHGILLEDSTSTMVDLSTTDCSSLHEINPDKQCLIPYSRLFLRV